MTSTRRLARTPLARLMARVLILALVAGLLPVDVSASVTAPPGVPRALPELASQPLADAVVVWVVVVGDPVWLTKDAFGQLLSHVGSDPQPYLFAGEPYDPNVRMAYHRARWMEPGSGRFLGMDPFRGRPEQPRTIHAYGYVGASPADAIDPSGLFALASISIGLSMMNVVNAIATVPASIGSAVKKLTTGIYMQAHGPYGLTEDVLHALIRIIPTDQGKWRARMPTVFVRPDRNGQFFATLGAESADQGPGTSLTVTAMFNRPTDVGNPKALNERLSENGFATQDEMIERLIDVHLRYNNKAPYNPLFPSVLGGYTSNSYVTGLLAVALVQPASFAGDENRLPGITRPIPPIYFATR